MTTDETLPEEITAIAKNLGALMTIWEACAALNWAPEYLFAQGLLLQLANLVENHTAPSTEEHQLARIALQRPEFEDEADEAGGGQIPSETPR